MTDEEITQIAALKKDRDNLRIDIETVKDRFKFDDSEIRYRNISILEGNCYRNKVLYGKINEIKKKNFILFSTILKNDLDRLERELTIAIQNYKGEEVKTYFGKKIKMINFSVKI